MQATTIKLDSNLHSAIRRLKSRDQSLTAYVRELVSREEKRAGLEQAADAYRALLSAHEDEASWLGQWESAPLAEAPKGRRRK
jgi:predicted transcriptional regulator